MAVSSTETKVSVSNVDEFIVAHPEIECPVVPEVHASGAPTIDTWKRREAALRMIVLERFPEWEDEHDIRCDFRGMDQEYHVVNQTLAPTRPIDETKSDQVIKNVEALNRDDYGRKETPDPLGQLSTNPQRRSQMRVLENISSMARNAFSDVVLTDQEFVDILMEIRGYASHAFGL